ncbi:thiamine pyrophosphokinase [Diaporthe amygdali]|uniref:thiamine pyrophosphokinase n=1 Tax=Phomopsis amygdali TaxID=1214568 RepID=UPI0022FDF6C2|nr:thiamine pyrophosphokinase [Diaporthe amygdali]KAJ0103751.1 thiamine pyrophosphokinase [Diaporthe amygdali]
MHATMADPIDWYPARILQPRADRDEGSNTPVRPNQFALIILNQPLRDVSTLKTLWKNSSLRVAADGGANRLLDVCQNDDGSSVFDNLDAIIGDLDSLTTQARQHFTTRAKPAKIVHDPDQYSTDFGKAVKWIRASATPSPEAGAGAAPPDIVAMGGLGGRVDQGLSQLHHLYLFQTSPSYAEGRLFLVSGESITFLLKPGKHRIHVRERDGNGERRGDVFDKYAGIVPVKQPSVITLRGFEWDVTDWETEFGGQMSTSNHVLPETEAVEVETTKEVLFTIALKR